MTSEAPGGISNHYNHVDDAHVLVRGEQRTESDRPTTMVRDEPDHTVSEEGEGEGSCGWRREGRRILSYTVRAKTGEGLLEAREKLRAAALRRSSDGIPSTERVVSSFFLSTLLSPASLYRRASSLFLYHDFFKPLSIAHAGRPAPPVSRVRVPILVWKDA